MADQIVPNPTAQPAIGINEEVTIADLEYHVQTEDLGIELHKLRTQVFVAGTVHKSYEADYSSVLTSPNLAKVVVRALRALHAKVIRRLRGGDSVQSIPPCIEVRAQPRDSDGAAPSPPKSRGQIWDEITQPKRFAFQPCAWDSIVERLRGPARESVDSEFDDLCELSPESGE